ncbi:MAG: YceI family protein [Mariniblastus sp.]
MPSRSKIRQRIIGFTVVCMGCLMLIIGQFATAGNFRQEAAKEAKYTIDNTHTSVVFAVSHFGLSYTYGRFNKCSGEFSLLKGEPTTAGFSFKIDAASIDTNNEDRDVHLRGPDFFNTEVHPEITFVTTGFSKVDGVYQVTGDMTMLGQTRTIKMPVQLVGIGTGPFGKQRAGFFTKFTIPRSDFGMDKMAGQIGNNISVTFSFEGVKQ